MVFVRIIELRTVSFEAATGPMRTTAGQDQEPFEGLPVICGVDVLDDRA